MGRGRSAARRAVPALSVATAVLGLGLAACGSGAAAPGVERVSGGPSGTYLVPPGIHKIRHVIVIMQENRSFDSYFGTFPGADGIPMQNGCRPCARPTPTRASASSPSSTMPTSTEEVPTARATPPPTSTAAP